MNLPKNSYKSHNYNVNVVQVFLNQSLLSKGHTYRKSGARSREPGAGRQELGGTSTKCLPFDSFDRKCKTNFVMISSLA